jgi:serine/threonine-protein kinase RsbW
MAQCPAKIKVPAKMEFLYPLLDFIVSCAEGQRFGLSRILEVELVMEEILVNIFSYAYPDRSGEVEIVCQSADEGNLLIEIADEGVPFNILTQKDPDPKAGIEERSIGGLGIYFVKQLVQEIQYQRENGRNILTLRIDSAPTSP